MNKPKEIKKRETIQTLLMDIHKNIGLVDKLGELFLHENQIKMLHEIKLSTGVLLFDNEATISTLKE